MLLENQNEGLNEGTAKDVISKLEPITKNADEDVRIPSLEQFTDIHTKIPAIKITLEAINELIPLLESNINKRKELIYDNILHLSQEGFFDAIKKLFIKDIAKTKETDLELKALDSMLNKIKIDKTTPTHSTIVNSNLTNNLGFCHNFNELLHTIEIHGRILTAFNNYSPFKNIKRYLITEYLDSDKLSEIIAEEIFNIMDKLNVIDDEYNDNYKINLGPLITNLKIMADAGNLDTLKIYFEKGDSDLLKEMKTLTVDEVRKLFIKIKSTFTNNYKYDFKNELNIFTESLNWLDNEIKHLNDDEDRENKVDKKEEKELLKIKNEMFKAGKATIFMIEKFYSINLKSIDILMEYINLSLKEYGIDTKLELSKEDFFDKLNKNISPKSIGLESFIC